jgi:hypothetical protein
MSRRTTLDSSRIRVCPKSMVIIQVLVLVPLFTSLFSNSESGRLPTEVDRSDAGYAVTGPCA